MKTFIQGLCLTIVMLVGCSGVEDMVSNLPLGWRVVEFKEYVIAIPPTLEELDESLPFYRMHAERGVVPPKDYRFFFPKGWGENATDDSIMCNVAFMDAAEVTEGISTVPEAWKRPKTRQREIERWRNFMLGGSDPQYMVGEPEIKAVRIFGGIYAMQGISRWRYPDQQMYGTIVSGAYLLQDKTRGTFIYYRYPESQAALWQKDMDFMVHTFRWK